MPYGPAHSSQPMNIRFLSILISFASSCVLCDAADVIASEKVRFKTEVVADGLETPWGIVKLPDGRFLVTERPGRLRVIADGKLLPEPVAGIPAVRARGQGGLLDIILHPHYETNGFIYLAFSDPQDDKAHTKIVRGRLEGNTFTDQKTIFEAPRDQYTSGGNHFGCRMQFDKDGYLFFSIGDRGDVTRPENNAQQITKVAGKIHRVRDDGTIPPDNPFLDNPDAPKSLWTMGNRNPQGLRFDGKGTLWETEHGPRGGDELNIIAKGKNYGWPIVTFGINYSGKPITDQTSAPGMEDPVIHWTPSIAVAGMDFYKGDAFPEWQGNLFVGALVHKKLVRCEIDADNNVTHQEILLQGSGRIRQVACFDDGALYLVYDNPGQVVRLVPADS